MVSYEGLMRPFQLKIKEFNLKDAPTTEKLYELMLERILQRHVSKETFAIRLEKNKQNWLKEWHIAVIVFEQLQNDCLKIKLVKSVKEYEALANTIVKDQLGLERCIENLKKMVNKYRITMSLAMDVEESDKDFYEHMNDGIQKIKRNTQIILQKNNKGE